jgi:hypothetical protein
MRPSAIRPHPCSEEVVPRKSAAQFGSGEPALPLAADSPLLPTRGGGENLINDQGEALACVMKAEELSAKAAG